MKFFKLIKKAFEIIIVALLILLIAFNTYIMACRLNKKIAFIGDFCIMKITTPSMMPSVQVGDFIIVKKVPAESLKTGDIISFYSEDKDIYGKINTHRIVQIKSDSFITRGDANPVDDSVAVRKEKIIGKYIGKIKFLKWLGSFTSSRKILMLCVIIPTLAIAIYEVVTISRIKTECDDQKEKLIRTAIDNEKKQLYEKNYTVSEVKGFESGKNNEKENVHSHND